MREIDKRGTRGMHWGDDNESKTMKERARERIQLKKK